MDAVNPIGSTLVYGGEQTTPIARPAVRAAGMGVFICLLLGEMDSIYL